MGRIVVEGENLIDVEEVGSILGISRATVFRLIEAGRLISVHVAGSKRTYITNDSMIQSKKPQEKLRVLYQEDLISGQTAELLKHNPMAFKKQEAVKKRQDRPWDLRLPHRRQQILGSFESDLPHESEE